MAQQEKNWDTSYEWKIILLLSITFGLVGLDRFVLPIILGSANSQWQRIWAWTPKQMAVAWLATSAWPGVFQRSPWAI